MSTDSMQVRDAASGYGVETRAPDVPPGYKRTEMGVIPEDWKVSTFDRVFSRINGKPFQIYTDAYQLHGALPVVDQGQSHIVGFSDDETRRFRCPEGGVIVFGDHTCLVKFVDHDFVVGADGTQIIATKPDHCARFHAFALQLRGIPPTGYNRHFKFLKERFFVSPSLEEQRAIAEALSGVDGLLGALEALIAKKRAIKQAAMQQLLTGKTRLPGFGGEWESGDLPHVATIRKGDLITASTLIPGPVPVIAGGVTPAYFHALANRSHPCITVSASGANAGYVAYHRSPIFASDCSTVEGTSRVSTEFLFYWLSSKQDVVYGLQSGGAQPHVQPRDLARLSISFPGLGEQRAIATVLSDMDAELAALEARRDKTRAIKQGMMQQLLTGRVRLVDTEITA